MSWSHLGTLADPDNPTSLEIPSIEINELGMTQFNNATNRTALGLAVNLPQFRYNDTYQIQEKCAPTCEVATCSRPASTSGASKFKSFFFPTIRGLLRYTTLNTFVNDPRRGGEHQQAASWW